MWFWGWYTSYSKIRNTYKNTFASEYSILLLIPSCTPILELGLLARDCQRKVQVVFSYLLACPKSERHVTCDLLDFTFVTTTSTRDTREETKKNKGKSSGEAVGVAFWPDLTQY